MARVVVSLSYWPNQPLTWIDETQSPIHVEYYNLDGAEAGTIQLGLESVTKTLQPTASYPITLTFAQAGEVTINVPVLRPGILAPGSTTLPTVVPDQPNGSTVPLQQRPEVSSSPAED